ncbi:chaperonin 10-like protein [Cadophora sp. MPI-SDFR-AT-0126]|nr:chaperonin 10-like protein [Leotiomycetes sp. MPI-SDFR-AT-0126]
MANHLAAVSSAKGQRFEVKSRPTPTPGPDEILIAVKSVALNPADIHMRDHGLFILNYPTVTGFDMSGLVLEIGSNVPSGSAEEPYFRPSVTRVAAYAASFWKFCNPDYGAFQERCLVPWQHAVPIPDEMSWNEAATLPVSVEVPLNAWDVMKIPRTEGATVRGSNLPALIEPGNTGVTSGQIQEKTEALLVWGASSSVGSMGVQSARLLRENPQYSFSAVYATASSANKNYVTSLGADRVFDYKDPKIVDVIVSMAKEDGLVIRYCFLATGSLEPCQAVLKNFLGEISGAEEVKMAKIASAPVVPWDAEVVDGIDTIFVVPPSMEGERLEHFEYVGKWIRMNLSKRSIRPSPKPRVVGKGLGCINDGLDMLRVGVSCAKLVVQVGE